METAAYLVSARSNDHHHALASRKFVILADAIEYATRGSIPCDVHLNSGAVAWTWEMR